MKVTACFKTDESKNQFSILYFTPQWKGIILILFLTGFQLLFYQAANAQIPTPQCACAYCNYPCGSGHSSSCPYSKNSSSSSNNSGYNWIQARKEAIAEQRLTRARELNQLGINKYNQRDWESAIKYFKQALKKSPSDGVIRQNLKNAENNLANAKALVENARLEMLRQEEERRRAAELKKMAAEKQRKFYDDKLAMLQLINRAGKIAGSSSTSYLPANNVVPPATQYFAAAGTGIHVGGLTEEEWVQAREMQAAIDKIQTEWPIPGKDIKLLDELIIKRNRLWEKAISIPGLTADERASLRLKLYTASLTANSPEYHTVPTEKLKAWKMMVPPINNKKELSLIPGQTRMLGMMSEYNSDKSQQLMEYKMEKFVQRRMGEEAGEHFSQFLAFVKIPYTAFTEGAAATRAEAADYAIGFITTPQSRIAVDGGRIYSHIFLQTINKFMEETAKSVNGLGGQMRTETFKTMDDLNTGHTAFKKWMRIEQ